VADRIQAMVRAREAGMGKKDKQDWLMTLST
jgi:hypothetical protein